MANDYLCPLCRGHLRLVSNIVISVKTKSHEKGLMFLDPKIGNYTKNGMDKFKLVQASTAIGGSNSGKFGFPISIDLSGYFFDSTHLVSPQAYRITPSSY